MKYLAVVGDQTYAVEINDETHVTLNGTAHEVDLHALPDQPVYSLLIEGQSFEAYGSPSQGLWHIQLRGRTHAIQVEDEREHRLRASMGEPGLIASVPVREGQEVERGSVLVVLESMKMQSELKSPRPGHVANLRVRTGQAVEQDQALLTVS